MNDELKRLQDQVDVLQERYQKSVAVIKQCKRELQGWVKEHGADLDTQEALIAATSVINLHARESGK